VALDRRTQLLYDERSLYVNGEATPWPAEGRRTLAALADRRRLDGDACRELPDAALAKIVEWYRHGYLGFADD
jgi:50S ribosomal protein L16 3-hydroxylase